MQKSFLEIHYILWLDGIIGRFQYHVEAQKLHLHGFNNGEFLLKYLFHKTYLENIGGNVN